jgi:hypothetical protein
VCYPAALASETLLVKLLSALRFSGPRRGRRGVLTLEWILLISVLVIGVIGGLGAVRDALICELKDLADCIGTFVDCDEPSECDLTDPNCTPQPCVCDLTDPNCCVP